MSREKLRAVIEDLWHNPPDWVANDEPCRYSWVIDALYKMAENNVRGDSYCGMASSMMLEHLPTVLQDAQIVIATAPVRNGVFHHYNVIHFGTEDPLICDLTAGQFFNRPLDVFGGKPYFLGTRDELRRTFRTAQENTWNLIQSLHPEKNFKNLWEVDLECARDWAFSRSLHYSLTTAKTPCILTESLYHGFVTTWGTNSRILRTKDGLITEFTRTTIPKTVTITTPKVKNLVYDLRSSDLTRVQGPKR